jgi:hypothetical protein
MRGNALHMPVIRERYDVDYVLIPLGCPARETGPAMIDGPWCESRHPFPEPEQCWLLWFEAVASDLRVACTLVANRPATISTIEVFRPYTCPSLERLPSMALWTTIRHMTEECAGGYRVHVTPTRLAAGVIFRVTGGRDTPMQLDRQPQTPARGITAWVQRCLQLAVTVRQSWR